MPRQPATTYRSLTRSRCSSVWHWRSHISSGRNWKSSRTGSPNPACSAGAASRSAQARVVREDVLARPRYEQRGRRPGQLLSGYPPEGVQEGFSTLVGVGDMERGLPSTHAYTSINRRLHSSIFIIY